MSPLPSTGKWFSSCRGIAQPAVPIRIRLSRLFKRDSPAVSPSANHNGLRFLNCGEWSSEHLVSLVVLHADKLPPKHGALCALYKSKIHCAAHRVGEANTSSSRYKQTPLRRDEDEMYKSSPIQNKKTREDNLAGYFVIPSSPVVMMVV